MRTIIDHAKDGVEHVGTIRRPEAPALGSNDDLTERLLRIRRVQLDVPTTNGVQETVEVVPIPIQGEALKILKQLASTSQALYVRTGGVTRHGMLSPNYTYDGVTQRSSVRFHGVDEDSFVIRGDGVWLPKAEEGLYLAGSTGLEAMGVGRDGLGDPEHKITAWGAAAAKNLDIATGHLQHDVRKSGGSLTNGLSNGQLGNVFQEGSIDGFPGFSAPVDFYGNEGAIALIPVAYLEDPEASNGAYMTDENITPEYIISGAVYNTVRGRGSEVQKYMRAMQSGGSELCQ